MRVYASALRSHLIAQMTFYWGSDVTLWFDGWQTGGSVHRFAFVLLSLFGLALGQEYLHAYRGKLGHDRMCVMRLRTIGSVSALICDIVSVTRSRAPPRRSTGRRALSSALYALQARARHAFLYGPGSKSEHCSLS